VGAQDGFGSELGDLLVAFAADGAFNPFPQSSSHPAGLAWFKVTATAELPAFWTSDELATHKRAEAGHLVLAAEGATDGESAAAAEDQSKATQAFSGEGEEHKLHLQFEARSDKRLKVRRHTLVATHGGLRCLASGSARFYRSLYFRHPSL
jgi:hypothetical protein